MKQNMKKTTSFKLLALIAIATVAFSSCDTPSSIAWSYYYSAKDALDNGDPQKAKEYLEAVNKDVDSVLTFKADSLMKVIEKTLSQKGQKNIYKVWMNEDGTMLFDLRDSTHYVEATKYDEDYCKDNPDYKPGVFYITTEAGGFIVSHNFESEGDTIGGVEYLIEEGPYAGTHALRFTFADMTPTSATFTFEGEYDWKYNVVDEPVELLPDPHPYVYEE